MISKIFTARRSTGIIKVSKLRQTDQVQVGMHDSLCYNLYLSISILYPILYERFYIVRDAMFLYLTLCCKCN